MMSEREYKEGKKEGIYNEYNENGNIIRRLLFKNNIPIN